MMDIMAATAPITTFAAVAVALHDNAYRPLPVVGKIPVLFGWNGLNDAPWDRDDLMHAAEEFVGPGYSCGLAVSKNQVAIDVDIPDVNLASDVATIAERTFGRTPLIRIGRAPKFARLYRCDDRSAIRSRRLHPIEIMRGSGQIVAFGIHPDIEQPYRWVGGASPLTIRADSTDIPAISERQLTQFLSEVFRIVPRTQGSVMRQARSQSLVSTATIDLHQRLRIDSALVGFKRAAIGMLQSAVEGNRHLTMWAVVSSAAGRGWDESRVIQLFEDHFDGWAGVSDDAFQRALHSCLNRVRCNDRF
jgi:hypothetical protein